MSERTPAVDEHNVLRLAHKYAYALDHNNSGILEKIFTRDAQWTFSDVPGVRGYDHIVRIPQRLSAFFKSTHHAIQTQYCELDGDEGWGMTYCLAYHFISSNFIDEGRDTILIGHNYLIRYDDKFRFDEGSWKFSARKLNVIVRRVDNVSEMTRLDRQVDW